MRKRILSLLLCIVLCMSLMPTAVFAENGVTDVGNYDELYDAVRNGDSNIRLTTDIAYNCPDDKGWVNVILNFSSGSTVIDLNNHTVEFRTFNTHQYHDKTFSFINLTGTASLTLKNGTITQYNQNADGRDSQGPIQVRDSATLTTQNANVENSRSGYAIYAKDSSNIYLNGGTITAFDGFAVYTTGGVNLMLDGGVQLRLSAGGAGTPTQFGNLGYGSLEMNNPTGANLRIINATLNAGVTIKDASIRQSAFNLDTHAIRISSAEVTKPIYDGIAYDYITLPESDRANYCDIAVWHSDDLVPVQNASIYIGNVSVQEKNHSEVLNITLSPSTADVSIGETQKFDATVQVTGDLSTEANWSVSGANSSNTTIDATGLLMVGTDETASTLTVTATAKADNSKQANATVNVIIPSSPKLATPTNLRLEGTTLKWDAVTNASSYVVDVYEGTTYISSLGQSVTTTEATFALEAGKTYRFEVYARGAGLEFEDSDIASATFTCTKLATPTNLRLEGTTLKWDAVTNASSYVVDVYEGTTYISSLGQSVTTTEATFALEEGKTYRFDVYARGAGLEFEDSDIASATFTYTSSTHTVSFEMNGHGDQIIAQTVEDGNKATKPTDPSASGYTFDGWYADATFSAAFDFNTAINADTTIYAKWTQNTTPPTTTYTVSFNMNGHGNQVAAQTVNEGAKATKPTDPTASGWTFDGWYADATFSAAFDFNTAINADTTIYAKWTQNTTPPTTTYTIIAGANGEWTKGSTTGLAFTSDAPFDKFDSVKVDGSTIAATNYTAEAGSTKITLAPAYLETMSVGSHSIVVVSTDGTASTNFTVKAAAQPPVPTTYTVSFDMNGHGAQISAQSVESGSKATKPADPKASGYTFGGWYADATCSTKFDFNSAITANTTVYAKWTKNSVAPTDPTTPQTGDNSNMFLWIVLLFVSGGALVGTAVYGKKKKYRAE